MCGLTICLKPFENTAKWLYLRPFLAEGVRGYWLNLRLKDFRNFGIGAWCNGSIRVSKTLDVSSNLAAPAKVFLVDVV